MELHWEKRFIVRVIADTAKVFSDVEDALSPAFHKNNICIFIEFRFSY